MSLDCSDGCLGSCLVILALPASECLGVGAVAAGGAAGFAAGALVDHAFSKANEDDDDDDSLFGDD